MKHIHMNLAPSARPFPVVLNRMHTAQPGSRHGVKPAHLPALVHYEGELHRDALLRHIPPSGDVKLDSFIATVFAEPTLSAAYWERFISPGHKPGGKPTLAIDLAVLAMERAMNYPPLRREERAVAGVAALLFDAGRYLDLYEKNRSQGIHPGQDEAGMFEARNAALYYALRMLRGRHPQVAALLGAVFQVEGAGADVEAEGAVDEHQLARVRAAVLRAHSTVHTA